MSDEETTLTPTPLTEAAASRAIAIGAGAYCNVTDGTAIGPGAVSTKDRVVVDTTTDPTYYTFLLYVLLTKPYMRIPERIEFLSRVLGQSQEELHLAFETYDKTSSYISPVQSTPSTQPTDT